MKTTWIALGALAAGCGGDDNGDNPTVDAAIDAPVVPVGAVLPLTTPDGSFYAVTLTMNNVGYALDLDTGSTTIGVAATACSGCPVTPKYAPGTGAVDTAKTASTSYGDGSGWSGEIFTDQMSLGGSTPTVGVNFVAINKQMNGFFADNSYQGIMGLGPKFLLENGTTSYVEAATAAGAVPVMGFEFCDDKGGTMWLGGYDATKASEPVSFAPLIPMDAQNNPFYAINITDMGLGGTTIGLAATAYQNPIVDTGTTIFYLPTPVDTALLAKINASAGFKALFPGQTLSDNNCAQGATTITAGQVDAMLPAMSLSFAGEDGTTKTVSAPPMASYLYPGDPGQVCFAFADGGSNFSVMGDTMLRAFLTVIDLPHGRVGFAPDKGCGGHQALFKDTQPLHGHGRPLEHGHPPRRVQR